MLIATDLKKGTTFMTDGKYYKVYKYTHQKIARGGGTVKLSVKNLLTGGMEEKTLSSNAKIEDIKTQKRVLNYLFKQKDEAVFMDPVTFEQISIPLKAIQDEIVFVKEGDDVSVLFLDNKPVSIEIKPKVTLKVVDTPPGVKGNSATNMFKSAKLENGLTVKVPLFVNNNDSIVVDTRDAQYVERSK